MNGPQVQLTGGAVLVGVGLVVGGVLLWRASKVAGEMAGQAWDGVKDGAATVGGWVNPASDQNLANQGVNAVGSYATGDPDWTLGSAVYDAQQERGFSNPLEIFAPSSAGLIAQEIGAFFGWGNDPAPPAQKGVTGTW